MNIVAIVATAIAITIAVVIGLHSRRRRRCPSFSGRRRRRRCPRPSVLPRVVVRPLHTNLEPMHQIFFKCLLTLLGPFGPGGLP